MQQLVMFTFVTCLVSGPVLVSAASLPHEDVREFIPSMIRNTAKLLDDKYKDQPEFLTQADDYKKSVDDKLISLLGDLSVIVRDYADHTGGLQGSTQQLIDDLNKFSVKFGSVPGDFPRLDEVQGIIKPQMDHLTAVLANEFPVMGPMPAQGFPLGHWYVFYQEAERRNSFGMGAFFRVEPLRQQIIRRTFVSRVNYVNVGGVETEEVIFEESQIFEDDQSVAHRIIDNGDVVLNEERVSDFSILHGLRAAMRRDSVNERFIRIVEEYVKLVNYYLVENFRERGLIIPVNHPQLAVPAGYTPDIFLKNFIALILAIQTPGSS